MHNKTLKTYFGKYLYFHPSIFQFSLVFSYSSSRHYTFTTQFFHFFLCHVPRQYFNLFYILQFTTVYFIVLYGTAFWFSCHFPFYICVLIWPCSSDHIASIVCFLFIVSVPLFHHLLLCCLDCFSLLKIVSTFVVYIYFNFFVS